MRRAMRRRRAVVSAFRIPRCPCHALSDRLRGRPRDRALAEAIHQYETRAARYWPLETKEVREEPARASGPAIVRERVAARGVRVPMSLRATRRDRRWPPRSSRDGCATSASVPSAMSRFSSAARSLSESCAAGRARRLGSRAGLPHELARLVLVEQLYRSGTIVRGEPYHK